MFSYKQRKIIYDVLYELTYVFLICLLIYLLTLVMQRMLWIHCYGCALLTARHSTLITEFVFGRCTLPSFNARHKLPQQQQPLSLDSRRSIYIRPLQAALIGATSCRRVSCLNRHRALRWCATASLVMKLVSSVLMDVRRRGIYRWLEATLRTTS